MVLLLHLQLKRMLKTLPKLLLGALLPLFLAALAIFYTKISSSSEQPVTLLSPVAIVNYDKKADLDFLLPYFSGVDATTGFRFVEMKENEAMAALSSGDVCAVLIFPEHMLAGILNSTNTPAKLYLPANSAVPSLLIGKFAEAGSLTLGTAQSVVYTAYDLYDIYQLQDYGDDINADINLATLHYALSRESLFSTRSVSLFSANSDTAAGTFSLFDYYGATLVLCLLLFLGAGCGGFLCNAAGITLSNQLKRNGIDVLQYEFSLFLPLFLLYSIFTGGLIFALSKLLHPVSITPRMLGFLIASVLCIALYEQFIFRLFGDAGRGLLVFLFSGFFFIFLSGGFLPYAFLPVLFQKITPYLPHGAILCGLRHVCAGAVLDTDLLAVLLHCMALLLLFVPVSILLRKEETR